MSTTNILDLNNRIDEIANSYPASKVMLNSGDSVEEKIGNVRMAKLWENPNPSADFAAQSLPLDLSGYGLIMVIATNGIISVASNVVGQGFDLSESMSGAGGTAIRRRLGTITATGITWEAGYQSTSWQVGATANSVMKPYTIYGIKLT